jgi:DNA repair protein RadC
VKLKNLHHLDQPRLRLLHHGSRSLSDAELVAIVLNQGSKGQNAKDLAIALMARFNNDIQKLFSATQFELTQFLGIGTVKATQLLACFELGRRLSRSPIHKPIIIKNSLDVFNHLKSLLSLLAHEEFVVLLLNNNNEIIHSHRLSRGGLTATVADGRVLFKIAFEYKATAIILCHNHPSGNPTPSEQDIRLTKNYRKFGEYIDLPILDHIIYSDFEYFSFADEGLLDKE